MLFLEKAPSSSFLHCGILPSRNLHIVVEDGFGFGVWAVQVEVHDRGVDREPLAIRPL